MYWPVSCKKYFKGNSDTVKGTYSASIRKETIRGRSFPLFERVSVSEIIEKDAGRREAAKAREGWTWQSLSWELADK